MISMSDVMPVVQKFIFNPIEGILEVQKMFVPGIIELEKRAGTRLTIVLKLNEDRQNITITLWKSPEPDKLSFWKAYSLPELIEEIKNFKNTEENGSDTAINITEPTNSGTEPTGNTDSANIGE